MRVRYAECDPQGIVYNANYVMYVDVAFTELWREALGPWNDMVERGIDAVVAEIGVRFRSPARFDDEIELHCTIAEIGTTSLTTDVEVQRDGELLVAARIRHVCVDRGTWGKAPWPDWVREGLAKCLV